MRQANHVTMCFVLWRFNRVEHRSDDVIEFVVVHQNKIDPGNTLNANSSYRRIDVDDNKVIFLAGCLKTNLNSVKDYSVDKLYLKNLYNGLERKMSDDR